MIFFERTISYVIVLVATVFLTILANGDQIKSRPKRTKTVRSLPEQNENWKTIREKNHLYVDKTLFVKRILQTGGKLSFIRRPPGFGKSMFLDMLYDFFRGEKDIFKGLKIFQEGNTQFFECGVPKIRGRTPKWIEFPAIYLKFRKFANFNTIEDFEKMYQASLEEVATLNNIDDFDTSCNDIGALIELLYLKFNKLPVIILADEYDYPLQYALTEVKDKVLAEGVKDYVDKIFTTIRHCSEYLGLSFSTGVWKLLPFASENGDNNFIDLSYDKDLAEAFGLTESEIKGKLRFYIKEFARNTLTTEQAENAFNNRPTSEKRIMAELKIWYGGYQFDEKNEACKVSNPVSMIQSLKKQKCWNRWTTTNSMDYLVQRFYEKNHSFDELKKGVWIDERKLRAQFDPLEVLPLDIWMILFGYYTISSYDDELDLVRLEFPNAGIERAVEENLAAYDPIKKAYFFDCYRSELVHLKDAMAAGNTREAMNVLRSFVFSTYKHYSGISSEEVSKRLEAIFSSANIGYRENIRFQKGETLMDSDEEEVDLRTTSLDTNYIIGVKCSKTETALDAIKQQMKHIRDNRKFSTNVIKNPDKTYLLGLDFVTFEGSARLNDWIVLPYENGNLLYSDVQADSEDLKMKFLKDQDKI